MDKTTKHFYDIWAESTEWVKILSVMGEYDHERNYVGAEGDWKSKLIPRKIMGVDMNFCAYIHDYFYFVGKNLYDKVESDDLFLSMMRSFIDFTYIKWYHVLIKSIALSVAEYYYTSVVVAGDRAFFKGKVR